MISKILVFISSTSDLKEERKALAREIRGSYEPYLYELDRPRGESPERHLLKILRKKTDVFLCVLGASYGSPYSKEDEEPSIVQWEFETAADHGKIEMLTYIKEPLGGSVDPRQQRFIDGVREFREGKWVGFFSAASELTSSATEALGTWLEELYIADKERAEKRDSIRRRVLIPIASGAVIVSLVATALAYWSDLVSPTALPALYAACIMTILGSFLVHQYEIGG